MYIYAQTYVVHVCTAHEYARTPTRQCQYGWTKSTNSRLTRSPESDPNARGRVRGIALLCVHMKNHHTSRREQIAMQLNEVANQFRFCGAKLLCNFLKVNYSLHYSDRTTPHLALVSLHYINYIIMTHAHCNV